MKTRWYQRSLSVLLTLVMVFNLLPSQCFAAETDVFVDNTNGDAIIEESTNDDTAAPAQTEPAKVVGEDPSKRGESYKEFILDNGLRLATVYPAPVHYETADGVWEEIDNTLVAAVSDGISGYRNAAGKWQVHFPGQLSDSNAITITKDGYTVSFGMSGELRSSGDLVVASIGSQVSTQSNARLETDAVQLTPSVVRNSVAQIQAMDVTAQKAQAQYPETVSDKLHSRVEYPTVYAGTTVRYDLSGQTLKESVILSAYDSTLWGYRYRLDTGTLVPTLNEDKSIDLCDPVTGATVLYLPAPFLLDDDGAWCGDVDVVLTPSGDGYLLSYYLPRQWLAEEARAWPVVLDPVVEANTTQSNIRDASVYEHNVPNGYDNLYDYLDVGRNDTNGIMRSFIKYANLPKMTSADMVIFAQLGLYLETDNDISTVIEARKVQLEENEEVWESETITWQNMPNIDLMVEDYQIVQDAGIYQWEITNIVRDWYRAENTGLVLKVPDAIENSSSSGEYNKQFLSSDNEDSIPPMLLIVFRNNNGLESYWDYTTTSAGRAGTGYVNDYTGNLVWIRDDIGFDGSRMPVSISHIYNSNDSLENGFGLGYGWRTNFNQFVESYENDAAVVEYYIWEDADGTSHYFYRDETVTDEVVYRDEDGLELTLKVGTFTDVSGAAVGIFDKDGNASYFDAKGRLIRLSNNQEKKSYITITYLNESSFKISTITDGVGRVYSFTYSGGLLSTLRFYGTGNTTIRTICYYYNGSQLTSVREPDAECSYFKYDSNNLLTTVKELEEQDNVGYMLKYSYYPVTYPSYQPYRVQTIAEFDGTTAGSSVSLSYGKNRTTFTDQSDRVQVKQFNNWGNTVSIQDDQGHGQYAGFLNEDPCKDSTHKGNQLSMSSKLQSTVSNLLTNSNFEYTSDWTATSADITFSPVTGTSYLGNKSLRMVNANEEGTPSGVSKTLAVTSGKTYTFSAYVKTSAASAYLSISDGISTATSEVLGAYTDWTRLQVSIPVDFSTNITVSLMTTDVGHLYMDCAQVEDAPTASRYNLVDNGDFRYGAAWSSTERYAAGTVAAPQLDPISYSYRITGDPSASLRTSQVIQVSGVEGDTFVVAGWAKGYSVPLTGSRKFGIVVNFLDGTTVRATKTVSFNPCVNDWQFVSQAIIADCTYTALKVHVAYDYNANSACFDGIQVFKEQFGQTYKYDDDGNLTSVTDLQKQETTYEYTNNKLTEMTLPTGAKLSYTYDQFGNVIRATTETGVVYEFVYDDWGNNTEVAIVSGTTRLKSTATYSSDGNRLVSTTDASGNTTTYGYNAQTNVLEWVQAPEDTDATRTEYTYDNMYRMASAAVTTDTGLDMSAEYTYTDDQLTAIETESTTYGFTYGAFGLRTSVKAGNYVLAEYEYTQYSNLVQKLTYGNGDHVTYSYDSTDRLVSQTYEDGETVSYQYDNDGGLAKMTDSESGITSTYYYDFIDRLCHYTEKADGYSLVMKYNFNTMDAVSFIEEIIDGNRRSTTITYDDDQRVDSIRKGTVKESYTYDAYSRVVAKATTQSDVPRLTEQIVYRIPATGRASGQVSSLTVSAAADGGYSNTFSYSYDANGNITDVISGGSITSYTYDTQNQLIREDNQAAGKSWTWTYDNAGNILSRTEYAFTTGTLGTALDTVSYVYSTGTWGDRLITYDGAGITYDNVGNPLTFGDRTLTWKHGRELASLTEDGTTWTYTYNADGLRIGRTNGTTTYQYIYADGQLVKQRIGTSAMGFSYDANGTPMSVYYAGAEYYYVTNLQGDVVAILDYSGAAVVTYTYDAWGKLLTTGGAMATTLGKYNPLRYRGYVYDRETELYYLQSRYYDPEMGRFVSADDQLSGVGGEVLGCNVFTYCFNNPVNMSDPTGDWPNWSKLISGASLLAVGLVACAAAATVVTGGACAPLLAAACVTFVAGGITALNGAAEMVESVTDYNYMRDGVYAGDSEYYETQKAVFAAAAEVGTAVLGVSSGSEALCFVAGTMVLASEGPKAIEDIQTGDHVWAWDENNGEVALKKVVETYVNKTSELVRIYVAGEEIVTTPSHPFYSPVKGWTDAVRLRAGDILLLVNGEYVVVEKVQYEILEAPVTVYNFQVDEFHTYYVTNYGVLVHNTCATQRGLQRQKAAGMTNTTPIKAPSGRNRIPDYLNTNLMVMGEAKSVKYLTRSRQLIDMFQYANTNGYKMFLKVESWTILSNPLRQAIQQYNVFVNLF